MMYRFVAPLLLFLHASYAQELVGLTLVNTATGQERPIEDGGLINLSEDGTPLTIRADVVGDPTFVEFDINMGETISTDNEAPYYLANDLDDGTPNPSAVLERVGIQTITIKVVNLAEGAVVDEETIQLTIVPSNAGPTLAPVTNFTDVEPYKHSFRGEVNGELKQWHKVTIGFNAFPTSETNIVQNPFQHYRLDVEFVHAESDVSYTIPGYFAADGNAANTGQQSGAVWLCHFSPDRVGTWTWTASFTEGINVAVYNNGTSASFFDGASGTFDIESSDKTGKDLRGKGRLDYVGRNYLQFQGSKEYYMKAGVASPENILAYKDFDNTPNISNFAKSFFPHERDYVTGDPTWAQGMGTGLIGAINYISNIGLNAITIQTLTAFGDDGNVFPWRAEDAYLQFDVSKLAQWEVVLEHADKMGLHIQVRTQEQENDQLLNSGFLGIERVLYYRELVARFSHHLALTWNLGEENTNKENHRKDFSDFIKSIDPYQHPVVLHAFSAGKETTYTPLLNYTNFDGPSLQARPENAHDETLYWVNMSKVLGKEWVVSLDEQNPSSIGVLPDSFDPKHNAVRKHFLWGNIMAGGMGVEWFFGLKYPESDLTLEDFRSREAMYNQSKYALDFFADNNISFQFLENKNFKVQRGTWALVDGLDTLFVVYLPDGGLANIDVTGLFTGATFTVEWYNPRTGGNLMNGTVLDIPGGSIASLGLPPSDIDQDWVALVRCIECGIFGLERDEPLSDIPSDMPSDMPSTMPSEAPNSQ